MNRKVFVIGIVMLAIFACMNVVSAGLFDVSVDVDVSYDTYNFDGVTLEIPDGASVVEVGAGSNDADRDKVYDVILDDGSSIRVCILYPSDTSAPASEQFQKRAEAVGGSYDGDYNGWAIIGVDSLYPFGDYQLAYWNGEQLIVLMGDNRDVMNHMADSYSGVSGFDFSLPDILDNILNGF